VDSGIHQQVAVLCLATSNVNGDCDASPKGGTTGFQSAQGPAFPDVAGNKLFHGYGNMPEAGLVFFIPGLNQTVRVNGRVKVIERSELADVKLEVQNPDQTAEVLQGLLFDVDESYSHCPQSMKFSNLWDVDEISTKIAKPPLRSKAPGV
jgi:uncharacterized protein